MTTTIQLPVSNASRELLLRDIENFTRWAEDREAHAEYAFKKAARFRDEGDEARREAQEHRDRVGDTLRVIALIDNHNLNFPNTSTDQPKEN